MLRLSSVVFLPFFALLACSGPAPDASEATSASEAAFTTVRLEKSRIEVFLNQVNVTSPVDGACSIRSVRFRITYENPTLPPETKVSLHAGESYADQDHIGDGFGWGDFHERYWGNIRDLAMTPSTRRFSVEASANPYMRVYQDWHSGNGDWTSQIYAATLQFVFRLELPDGTVLWDNRLRQDYWVSSNGPACPYGSTGGFVQAATWGPF